MKPFATLPEAVLAGVRGVLADIDDTVTTEGRLPATSLAAMEALQAAGVRMMAITGRPAGWCDHIARMWPVDAVVGENGAFYFHYDATSRRLRQRFVVDAATRAAQRAELGRIAATILAEIPGAALASDQHYREADLAIDFCEDVPPLPRSAVLQIAARMTAAGLTAKISSIHVNGWFGGYDKRSTTTLLLQEVFGESLAAVQSHYLFVGDSPNDAPMFASFTHSVGVANVVDTLPLIATPPAYVTAGRSAAGFAEVAARVVAARRGR